ALGAPVLNALDQTLAEDAVSIGARTYRQKAGSCESPTYSAYPCFQHAYGRSNGNRRTKNCATRHMRQAAFTNSQHCLSLIFLTELAALQRQNGWYKEGFAP